MTTRLRMMAAGLLATASAFILPAQAAEVKVAVVQSMTGALAFVGVPLVEGMKIAEKEINDRQLLGPGNTLKVIYEDDEVNRAQAVSLINRFAVDKDVMAILGPTTTTVAIAGAQAANDNKIAAIVTTNSPEIAVTGPYGFRLSQPPDVYMDIMGAYTVEKLKQKECLTIGVLDSAAYVEQVQAFSDAMEKRGAKIISKEGIKQADTDFAALSVKVVGMKPPCIYISALAATAANLIMQLRQAGLDPDTVFVGMTSMASPDLMKVGGEAVENLYLVSDWVPGGTSDSAREFVARFKTVYGREPDNWGPMGYGAMRVVAEAIRLSMPDPTREKVRDNLAAIKDFPILLGSGKFSYDSERAPRYGTNVLVVKDGKFVLAP